LSITAYFRGMGRIAAALGLGAALLAATVPAAAGVIYVNVSATGAGNGTNWTDAYTAVPPALDAAAAGDQVWVARGRYVGCITLKLDVGLYGGFGGTEDPANFDLANRDFVANETILDGNQAGSVVTGPAGATDSCRIDGFTITKGTGALVPQVGSRRYGGGICLVGSAPTIENCLITANTVLNGDGGGLYLNDSAALIAHNTIAGNSAGDEGGGGLHIAHSSPTIVGNRITGNHANPRGGGLLVTHASSPSITQNEILDNSAIEGGGVAVVESAPTIASNTLSGNSAYRSGGALFIGAQSAATITGNTITDNDADSGGGLHVEHSAPTLTGNLIARNDAAYDFGGGIYLYTAAAPDIAENTIEQNTAAQRGGGVYFRCSEGTPSVRYNSVERNAAPDGAGMYVYRSSGASIVGNNIGSNSATGDGGGIYVESCWPELSNNVLIANTATNGGGLYVESTSVWCRSNTIAYNVATQNGGGVFAYGSFATIANSIVAFNSSGIFDSNNLVRTRSSCVARNSTYDYGGTLLNVVSVDGNLSADPRFIDAPQGNYRLQSDSRCVDAGSNDFVYGPEDGAALPRVVDGDGDSADTIDIGAFEFQGPPPATVIPYPPCPGDLNCDGAVTFADINPFVQLLTNQPAWQAANRCCDPRCGDVNNDGIYGTGAFGDINPFVALLTASPLPTVCP
jgi:hypothetical protein